MAHKKKRFRQCFFARGDLKTVFTWQLQCFCIFSSQRLYFFRRRIKLFYERQPVYCDPREHWRWMWILGMWPRLSCGRIWNWRPLPHECTLRLLSIAGTKLQHVSMLALRRKLSRLPNNRWGSMPRRDVPLYWYTHTNNSNRLYFSKSGGTL